MSGILTGQCHSCKAHLFIGGKEEVSSPVADIKLEDKHDDLNSMIKELEALLHKEKPEVDSIDEDESYVMLQYENAQDTERLVASDQQEAQKQQNRESFEILEGVNRSMDVMNILTGIKYPICSDCAKEIERAIMRQVEDAEHTLNAYEELHKQYQAEGLMDATKREEQIHALEEKITAMEVCLTSEREKTENIQDNLVALKNKEITVKTTLDNLACIEEKYWRAFHVLNLALHETADFRDDLEGRIKRTEDIFDDLSQRNVLADVFHIWHDGPFGTISGLRLGSTPDQPVEWWEINAAWGQVVLLLDILAKSLNIAFDCGDTILEPRGSFSRVFEKAKGWLELYGPVNKILCLSFDRAQTAILRCIKQLAEEIGRRGVIENGSPFQVKYHIDGDRIAGFSIRYGLARDKAWTKALKYTLASLKSCLRGVLEFIEMDEAQALQSLPREGPHEPVNSDAKR